MLRKMCENNQLHKLSVFMIAILFTAVVVPEQGAFAQSDRVAADGSNVRGGADDQPDVILWDLDGGNCLHHARAKGRPAGGGGGGVDIVVFDIVDSVATSRVMVLGESIFPGVYEVLVDTGKSIEFGLMWDDEQPEGRMTPVFRLTIMF
jgi:hypothetical protein